jgi:hypothetical protein
VDAWGLCCVGFEALGGEVESGCVCFVVVEEVVECEAGMMSEEGADEVDELGCVVLSISSSRKRGGAWIGSVKVLWDGLRMGPI